MSFGYSISDVLSLGHLAWNVVQNSRKACGEHDSLTREVSALDVVIRRLGQEAKKPESPINVSAPGDTCREELRVIMADCGKVLRVLDTILNKYNALSEKERSGRKLWQKIRFGNGEMADLNDLRSKVLLYTSSITFYLNMISMGTVGRIEQEMNRSGGILREIQIAINGITTEFISKNKHEGSVFTNYTNDDKSVWREFRRELRQDGFSSSVIHKHKRVILDYIKELGSRGLLDEQGPLEADGVLQGSEPELEINQVVKNAAASTSTATKTTESAVETTEDSLSKFPFGRDKSSSHDARIDVDELNTPRMSMEKRADLDQHIIITEEAVAAIPIPFVGNVVNEKIAVDDNEPKERTRLEEDAEPEGRREDRGNDESDCRDRTASTNVIKEDSEDEEDLGVNPLLDKGPSDSRKLNSGNAKYIVDLFGNIRLADIKTSSEKVRSTKRKQELGKSERIHAQKHRELEEFDERLEPTEEAVLERQAGLRRKQDRCSPEIIDPPPNRNRNPKSGRTLVHDRERARRSRRQDTEIGRRSPEIVDSPTSQNPGSPRTSSDLQGFNEVLYSSSKRELQRSVTQQYSRQPTIRRSERMPTETSSYSGSVTRTRAQILFLALGLAAILSVRRARSDTNQHSI